MTARQPTVLHVDPRSPDEVAIRKAVAALRAGRLVILPTETVYGLAADPRVDGAEERMFRVKKRDRGKPIALLACSLAQVEQGGARVSRAARRLAERYWPGPLTLVLPDGAGREEGFRVPDYAVTLAVLRAVGTVLRVTSANLSGQPPARTAAAAVGMLGTGVALVLDAGPSPLAVGSTVVRIEGDDVKILREGVIPTGEIRAAARGRPR